MVGMATRAINNHINKAGDWALRETMKSLC